MYQKILVPLDGSKLAECVLPHVETIVKGCGVREVIFVQAVEPFYLQMAPSEGGTFFRDKDIRKIEEADQKAAANYLNQVLSRVKYDTVNVRAEIISGKAADTLVAYATKNEVDLILVATHGRSGVSRWVWGSVADRILRSACIPVLMIRAPGCAPGI